MKMSISFSKWCYSIVSIFQYSQKFFLKNPLTRFSLLSIPVAGTAYELQGTPLTTEIS